MGSVTDPLDGVASEAILWVVRVALGDGGEVAEVADWSKARVVHMKGRLPPGLKARVEARWPTLIYFNEAATPHNAAEEGFIDGGFAVSFPTGR